MTYRDGRPVDDIVRVIRANVRIPRMTMGDINAQVLRTGRVENTHPALTPREDAPAPTERSLQARAGNGGATLSFTVTDGTLRIKQVGSRQ